MAAVATSCNLMFIIRSKPLFISCLKPLVVSSYNIGHIHVPPLRKPLFSTSSSTSLVFSEEGQDLESCSPLERKREERVKLEVPILTVKERKELASYAHSLGDKLKTQLVGKSGVTSNLATSFIETLEANELLKIKIHRSCPGELDEVVKQLEEATGSVAVGQIGRTLIIYRPSLSKMKAEEKKKQVRNLILKKQVKPRLINKNSEQVPKLSWPGSSGKGRKSRS